MRTIVCSLFFLQSFIVQSQEIKVEGNFLEDSTEIGNVISYNLKISYPKNLEIIVTDSNYNYDPFEFVEKSFIPTISDSLYNYDSIIFKLTSYSIDKTQFLKLPVFLINSKDSTLIYSNIDSIRINEFITELSDSLSTKSNTNFLFVNIEFNYPLFYYISISTILILVVLYIIFRKKIIIYFKTRFLKNEYNNYIIRMKKSYNDIIQEFNRKKLEKLLLIWKRYNEKITDFPYSSLTTHEIIKLGIAKDLSKTLQSIDKIIYANYNLNNFKENFKQLVNHSLKLYDNKLKEIRDE